MKKILFTELTIVIVSVIILIILCNISSKNNILYNSCNFGNYKNCDALLTSCIESESFDMTADEWIQRGE